MSSQYVEKQYIVTGGEESFHKAFGKNIYVDDGIKDRLKREMQAAENDFSKCRQCKHRDLMGISSDNISNIEVFDEWLSNFDKKLSSVKDLWHFDRQLPDISTSLNIKIEYLRELRKLLLAVQKME